MVKDRKEAIAIGRKVYLKVIEEKINKFFEECNREYEFHTFLKKTKQGDQDEILELLNDIKKYKIPENFNCIKKMNTVEMFELRDILNSLQGFTLVSKDWILKLKELIGNDTVLEVMAGCGSLSYALKEEGCKIISATDNFSWKANPFMFRTYMDIEKIDCVEAVKKYGKDIKYIIMAWPYMDNNAYKVLEAAREINKDIKIIYIGEWKCGCTADEEFFDSLVEVPHPLIDDINEIKTRWEYLHDYVYLIK